MVRSIARKMSQRSTIPFDDLVQIGSFGLLDAIARFDPSRGFKLSTYAWYRIKGEMATALKYEAEHKERFVLGSEQCVDEDFKPGPVDVERSYLIAEIDRIAVELLSKEEHELLRSYVDGRTLYEAAPTRYKSMSSRIRSRAARIVRAAIQE